MNLSKLDRWRFDEAKVEKWRNVVETQVFRDALDTALLIYTGELRTSKTAGDNLQGAHKLAEIMTITMTTHKSKNDQFGLVPEKE